MTAWRKIMYGRAQQGTLHWRRLSGGFTLIELLTASIIVSLVLMGVYSLFHNSVRTEIKLTQAWQERSVAETVVSAISRDIKAAVELKDMPLMEVGNEDNGTYFFTCITHADVTATDATNAVYEWRRYSWDDSGTLELQVIPFSGTRPVGLHALQEGEDPWGHVSAVVIGRQIKSLSIQFRSPNMGDWANAFSRYKTFPTTIRITATVGQTTIERYVQCHVNTAVI